MAADSTAFSSSGEDAIYRQVSLNHAAGTSEIPNPTTRESLAFVENIFEVEWTAMEIDKAGYSQVALQFPDELLHISTPVFRSLRRRIPIDTGLYILADTSYGSCCVDEVAAQHINADVIVHYGYSCLSKPSRIPVLYVFSKAPLDVSDAAESLLKTAYKEASVSQAVPDSPHFILIPDVAYAHLADELCAAIRTSSLFLSDSILYYDAVPRRAIPSPPSSQPPLKTIPTDPVGSTAPMQSPPLPNLHRRYILPASVPVSSCIILYVGPESLGLTNLLMTHPGNIVVSYNSTLQPPTAQVVSTRTNRLLMRRYAVVQQARDADVIGILVGTLGVASYLPLLAYLRNLLKRHHKKSYTLCVGKLNPAKLANFPEIECFVMVACPENSVVDAKEFLRPIVTPFELCLALNSEPSWPGNYILDFERVIEHPATTDPDREVGEEHDAEHPVFSFVTGKYRHVKRYGQDEPPSLPSGDGSSVILRNTDNALTRMSGSAGADFLNQRTFKGLEQRLGENSPSVLEQGRRGVARGYQDDHIPPETTPG